jgi:uncharacterized membrane protein YqjE
MANRKNQTSGKSGDVSLEGGVGGTFAHIFEELTTLVQTELRLLRTELSQTVASIGIGVGLIVSSAILLMAAAMLFLQVIIATLVAYGWSLPVATLVVAVTVLILGVILFWLGLLRLQAKSLAPTKTVDQLERDVALVKSEIGAS